MCETTGGSAGTHPAACSSPSHSPHPWRQGRRRSRRRRKKKENSSLCTAKTSSTSQAVLLLSFKRSRSLRNNFPTIATVLLNAAEFSFGPYKICVPPMTKGNCAPKRSQLYAVMFFSWHILTRERRPDLIVDLQRDPIVRPHVRVCCSQAGAFFQKKKKKKIFCAAIQVSYDLRRNVETSQIHCSRLSERFAKRQREKRFFLLEEAFKASLKWL